MNIRARAHDISCCLLTKQLPKLNLQSSLILKAFLLGCWIFVWILLWSSWSIHRVNLRHWALGIPSHLGCSEIRSRLSPWAACRDLKEWHWKRRLNFKNVHAEEEVRTGKAEAFAISLDSSGFLLGCLSNLGKTPGLIPKWREVVPLCSLLCWELI